jgi:hypothetical protein
MTEIVFDFTGVFGSFNMFLQALFGALASLFTQLGDIFSSMFITIT